MSSISIFCGVIVNSIVFYFNCSFLSIQEYKHFVYKHCNLQLCYIHLIVLGVIFLLFIVWDFLTQIHTSSLNNEFYFFLPNLCAFSYLTILPGIASTILKRSGERDRLSWFLTEGENI